MKITGAPLQIRYVLCFEHFQEYFSDDYTYCIVCGSCGVEGCCRTGCFLCGTPT